MPAQTRPWSSVAIDRTLSLLSPSVSRSKVSQPVPSNRLTPWDHVAAQMAPSASMAISCTTVRSGLLWGIQTPSTSWRTPSLWAAQTPLGPATMSLKE